MCFHLNFRGWQTKTRSSGDLTEVAADVQFILCGSSDYVAIFPGGWEVFLKHKN